jgi:serine/threonine protein kinase
MSEMASSSSLLGGMSPEVVRRRIISFGRRFGQAHVYLACHAAFPMALTPELLYRLWANFPYDIQGKQLKIPWIAVADLLLSSLCEEVGHELYEMNVFVRAELLSNLKANPNFGDQRINELSNFLLSYIKQQLNSPDPSIRNFARTQQWTALAYIKPNLAARKLAEALTGLDWAERAEQVRLASVVETFAEQLSGFAPLLMYARGLAHFAYGEIEDAVVEFNKASEGREMVEVEGVKLRMPMLRSMQGEEIEWPGKAVPGSGQRQLPQVQKRREGKEIEWPAGAVQGPVQHLLPQESYQSISSEDVGLPARWEHYLRQIDEATRTFWQRRPYRDYGRLQDARIWSELRATLRKLSQIHEAEPLTPFETFLLYGAVCLYEAGWQALNAPLLTVGERYAQSGQMIRNSISRDGGGIDFGLSALDPTTIDTLAQICAAAGWSDLTPLSMQPEPAGYQEKVRLRYLVALLQLADQLFVHRANSVHLHNLVSLDPQNLADARFALQPYITLIELKKDGLTTHFHIHSDDEPLADKMRQLFEAPIRELLSFNWRWLSTDFHFFLALNEPKIEIVRHGSPPEPLKRTCKALINFLEAFKPSELQVATAGKDLEDLVTEAMQPAVMSLATSKDLTVQVGQRLWDQYEVLKIAGRTNHSLVVKAWDVALQRNVAIKFLSLDQHHGNEVSDLLRRNLLYEARILANLDHKNIGKVYVIMPDSPAIVMQWIEGSSLGEILSEDLHMPIADVIRIGMELTEALDYIHTRGIMHRDIKPNNIILNEGTEPILIDFDVARSRTLETITHSDESSSGFVGTLQYAAPEQFEHPEAVGPNADIFALGVLLYQLLTLQRPYQYGNNPKHYNGHLPKPERYDIPEPLYQTICTVLSLDPSQRPSAITLHEQLQTYLATSRSNKKGTSRSILQHHITFCSGANLNIIQAGNQAEFNTVQFLVDNLKTSLLGDYHILVNYNLPLKGSSSREIDLIVINKFGVFLLEVKSWIGHIEAFDDLWIVGNVHKRVNPLDSINSTAKMLYARFFGERGELRHLRGVNVTGLVVLTQGKNHFRNNSSQDSNNIVGLDSQLLQVLSSTQLLRRGSASRILNERDMQQVREALLGKHQARREELIGDYRILKELSFGDLFEAYEAQNINIPSQLVRLKRYQLPKLSQSQMEITIRQFKRSVEAVSALGPHPNILYTLNFFPDPERPDVFYEITELVTGSGGRLDEIMVRTKGMLALNEQLKYLEPLCSALQHAHNHKGPNGHKMPVYHRNIGPETVFVTDDNIVKLGDFDFAKFGNETISVPGQILIEKPFTAPEIFENSSLATAASDIYALGVLWYFLACLPTQQPKFDLKRIALQIDALKLPEAARALMKKMTAQAPVNRPQNIEEVLKELKQLKT